MNMSSLQVAPVSSFDSVVESDPQRIRAVFDSQLATSLRWRESTARERINRIKKLRDAMMARREAFYDAFMKDYRKSPSEVEASEFLPVRDEARQAIGRVKRWMKPTKVWPTSTMLGTSASVQYQPRGRVLIIAPWNYPLSLCFGPLVSALAAGNTAIIKPSEMTPAVSALMASIIQDIFPENEVALFQGSLPTSKALLDRGLGTVATARMPDEMREKPLGKKEQAQRAAEVAGNIAWGEGFLRDARLVEGDFRAPAAQPGGECARLERRIPDGKAGADDSGEEVPLAAGGHSGVAGGRVDRHDFLDRLHFRNLAHGDTAQDNIAVRHHADQFRIIVADRQGTDIELLHQLRGLLNIGIKLDARQRLGHDFPYFDRNTSSA